MASRTTQNVTLGIFVTVGILLLVVALYLIGKNQSLFGASHHLRAHFQNVSGLMKGNNIRFSGIQSGTVNKITVLDDTTIEIDMLIEDEMMPFIRRNAIVTIGNDGLMGNKVINITPARQPDAPAEDGDLLVSRPASFTNDMLETLSGTNDNVAAISAGLVETIRRINQSKVLWAILDDTTLPGNLQASMQSLRSATANIDRMTADLGLIIDDVRAGKGAAGAMLTDEKVAQDLRSAVANVNKASEEATRLLGTVDSLARMVSTDIEKGPGAAHTLLRDPAVARDLQHSMGNVERGTAAFEQSMEALKHNFLLRGYFRKAEKKKQKGK